ncbi:MAG: hypothetical protein ACHRHE_10470 [Tepidisphaerales bacterium]
MLMHLAGELSAEDAAEMERLLAADAGLRGQLDELRQLQDELGAVIAGEGLPGVADAASVQRTMRAVRLRKLELAARPLVEETAARVDRRRTVLQYSLVAVAASVALFIGLWGLGVFNGLPRSVGPEQALVPSSYDGIDPNLVVRDDADKRLDEAAEHIRALRANDDEDRLLLML